MTAETNKTANANEIRTLVERRAEAVRARDVDGAMANVARDVLVFEVVDPLQYVGRDAVRNRLEEWFASYQDGPFGYEVMNLSITAGDEVAFCNCINEVRGTRTDGQEIEMRWRATTCFRKIDGTWIVTHEHASDPFHPETGMASIDLAP